jgi:predicted metal-binding membrane protein
MTIMGALGLMNLAWTALFGSLALAERIIPGGERLGKAAGIVLCAWGVGSIVMGA